MKQKEEEKHFRHRPDSCWSWVICAASFVSLTIAMGYSMGWGVILPAVMDHFNETRAKTALVGALGNGLGYLLCPLVSILCTRVGCRITALLGALLVTTGFVLSSIVTNLSLMFLTYSVIAGIGYNFILMANFLIVLKYFVKRRAIAVGIATSATCCGILVSSQSNTALLENFGLEKTFRAMAITMCVPFLCAFTFDPSISPGEEELLSRSSATEPKKVSYFGFSAFRNKVFSIYAVSFTVVYLAYFVFPIHAVKYADELGIARHDVVNLYIYLAISQFFSRHLFCYIASCKAINRFYLYQVAASACGIVYLTVPLATSVNHLLVIFIAIGLLDGGLYGISPLLVTDSVDETEVPQAWGLLNTTTVFSAVGPFLAGLMADELNSYVAAFYTSGSVILFGASFILFTKCVAPRVKRQVAIFKDTTILVVERETVL